MRTITTAEAVQQAAGRVARAITDDAAPGHDATGGTVASLTEAVMGITAALVQIADSINALAEAVREHGCKEVP